MMEFYDTIDTSDDCMSPGKWPSSTHKLLDGKTSEVKRNELIMLHVLPLLPAKSLMRFKCVSKQWYRWISTPILSHRQSFSFRQLSGYFYQDQTGGEAIKFFSLDGLAFGVPRSIPVFQGQDKALLCSANGLLLLRYSESYCVCNPATGDWRKLPAPGYYHGYNPAAVLAFSPSLQNIEAYYQVVCAFTLLGSPVICFEIYSSATRSWRVSSALCPELGDSCLSGSGFYSNGCVWWEMTVGAASGQFLVALDIESEQCGVVAMPSGAGGGTFTQVQGEVCYVTSEMHSEGVFVVDIYGGLDMGLKRSVCLNLFEYSACRVVPAGGECLVILCEAAREGIDGKKRTVVQRYDMADQRVETVCRLPGGIDLHCSGELVPYVNSLAIVA
ncbi:unnamed protein product [Cuscuta campestris]|uniref:F-box domain-containing protein n=1 Tax=Cuscuta campestris TaxID=132261 RepID=A0A484NHZ1_9ASTE|nr:unnamed protein product [Cuscuta campestris]